MAKKTNDTRFKKSHPKIAEPTPPRLSEELIAQLQGAVSSARRKRMQDPVDAAQGRPAEKDL